MNTPALSIRNMLIAKIRTLLPTKRKSTAQLTLPLGMRKLDILAERTNGTGLTVETYTDPTHGKIVCKYHDGVVRDLYYLHLLNESNVLSVLQNQIFESNTFHVRFPKKISTLKQGNVLALLTEFEMGSTLSDTNQEVTLTALDSVIDALQQIYRTLSDDERYIIPKRTAFDILASFPYYMFRAMIKDLRNILTYLSLSFTFYRNYLEPARLMRPMYSLTHRDLHPANIILRDSTIVILDPGIIVRWDPEADLAILPIIYFSILSKDAIAALIKRHIRAMDKRRYKAIQTYYLIETLALMGKHTRDYLQAVNYMHTQFDYFQNL